MKLIYKLLFSLCIIIIALSCTKKTGSISLLQTTDLYPLSVGKVYIYRMDSTILNAGRNGFLVHTYIAKDSVESQFYDATGRLSYRMFRYLSDTAYQTEWNYVSTIVVTYDVHHVEYIENNLKFVTIAQPISDGTNWYGNEYINTTVADNDGNTPFKYFDKWQYTYQNSNQPYTVLGGTYDSTYTVLQQNSLSPDVPIGTVPYQQNNYSVEIYAKHVGLIYKEFLHWTWQTNSYTDNPLSDDGLSYGIKLNLLAVR